MTPSRLAADGIRARSGGPWTKEKLVYLQRYATGFMTAMAPKRDAGKWSRLVFIDPLCGPGMDVNKKSGEEFKGSPLIALGTQPAFDYLYLGDRSKLNVAALRQRIAVHDSGRVSLECEDCHTRIAAVVGDMTAKMLGLAFVDPEGFEVRFELLRTLAERRIDILFLFPSGIGIARNLRAFAAQPHSPMDDLWGDRTWRDTPLVRLLTGASPPATFDEALDRSWVAAFCNRVATLGYTHHEAVGRLWTETRAPMYHLLFFSKHPAGLTIWRGVGRIGPDGQRTLNY